MNSFAPSVELCPGKPHQIAGEYGCRPRPEDAKDWAEEEFGSVELADSQSPI